MSSWQGESWTPSRELLAAFADGELETPSQARLCREIEDWLARHPEAAAELDAQHELRQLMAATTPVEPPPAAWLRVWWRVLRAPPPRRRRLTPGLWVAGLLAGCAAAVVAAILLLGPGRDQSPVVQHERDSPPVKSAPERPLVPKLPGDSVVVTSPQAKAGDVLEVATSEEVEIMRVAGADTDTLVIGQLPLVGPIILLQPHEVDLRAPANDPARPEVRGSLPMIWTPLPGANDEDKEVH
jgi:hypothetical protein